MQIKSARRPQAERRAETRDALLIAARKLFAEKGYAETGTPEIVKEAKVTRGALYHHFTDKADLLSAVLEREAEEIAEQIGKDTNTAQSPLDALLTGAKAYFIAMSRPGRTRLLLLEGPAVLTREHMKKINLIAGEAALLEGLVHAKKQGFLGDHSPDVIADLLSAAFDRAALAIANGGNQQLYERAIEALLHNLLSKGS